MRPHRRVLELQHTLTQHQQIQHLLRVHDGLAEVRHQANQSRVPLVRDLREGGRAGRHQYLSDTIFKRSQRLLVDLRIGSNSDQRPRLTEASRMDADSNP